MFGAAPGINSPTQLKLQATAGALLTKLCVGLSIVSEKLGVDYTSCPLTLTLGANVAVGSEFVYATSGRDWTTLLAGFERVADPNYVVPVEAAAKLPPDFFLSESAEFLVETLPRGIVFIFLVGDVHPFYASNIERRVACDVISTSLVPSMRSRHQVN